MLPTLTLLALSVAPGQGAGLTVSNPRVTYGELGSPRPDNKFLPGDVFFLSCDVDGIRVSETGRVRYGMAMEVLDGTGKAVFKEKPIEQDEFLPLGGTKLPIRAFVYIGRDQPAGTYTCKVTVTDLSLKNKPEAKTIEQKFEVVPRGFGIVKLHTTADPEGKVQSPTVGIAGQNLFVHFTVTDFQQEPATKQPNLTLEMIVYDKDRQPTVAKPTVKQVPDEADGKVDERAVDIPMRFVVPLNREGGYLIEIKATDNVAKKTAKVYLPLRVFPAGN